MINQQAYRFLRVFFDRKRKKDYIEIRCVKNKGPVISLFYKDINKIDWDYLKKLNGEGFNIYFSVCPRRRKGRKKEDVSQVLSLWADIDLENDSDVESVSEKVLKTSNLHPSIINFSGHGLQAFWLLEKPCQVTQRNAGDFESHLRHLQKLFNGDPSVCELAHMMRSRVS